MNRNHRNHARVEVATEQDILAAARRTLRRAGVTVDELREQAREGRFSSERARLAWFMISPVADRI